MTHDEFTAKAAEMSAAKLAARQKLTDATNALREAREKQTEAFNASNRADAEYYELLRSHPEFAVELLSKK
jgi:hypothetical protein